MAKLRYFFLTILLLNFSCLLNINSQPSRNMYVCGKDYYQSFPVSNISKINFRKDYTLVDARRFQNNTIDSIVFQLPSTTYYNNIGKTETVQPLKGATILDITARDEEDESEKRNVYSAWYMLNLAGMPFSVTTDLDSALNDSRLIVVSSTVRNIAFSDDELQKITSWVKDGGILVITAATPGQKNQTLKDLVGYDSTDKDDDRNAITWIAPDSTSLSDYPFDYIDTDEEMTISIGRNNSGISCYAFKDIHDSLSNVEVLGNYNTGEVAALRCHLGKGYVYSYGVVWGELIQRSQFNRDPSAQRSASNTFEPSADVIAFQIRSLYNKSEAPSVWKFTIPDRYESVLIPTHDCDSKTALDSMYYMSNYEKELGASCHYFITTHYYAEPQDTGEVRLGYMYTPERLPHIKALLANGHTVGSHSIGHFPDFDKVERFPMTVITRDDYHAMFSNRTQSTSGGSTWAEVVLSKQILQGDLGNNVLSFRTGHLCMNDSIPHAEQIGGYKFASCFTASDVLSEFPYQERIGRDFGGDFNGVLEMPLHFSDVLSKRSGMTLTSSNWQELVKVWGNIHSKLAANYAPAIILIHPNREWKMEMEKMLVESYDSLRTDSTDTGKIGLYNFEAYGNFWNTRSNTNFTYGYDKTNNIITIHLLNALDNYSLLPFAIENLNANNLPTVHLTAPDNKIVAIGRLNGTGTTGRYICVF